jgi:hypothetical protein
MANALGKDSDAKDFALQLAKAKSSFERIFVDPSTGLVIDGEGS